MAQGFPSGWLLWQGHAHSACEVRRTPRRGWSKPGPGNTPLTRGSPASRYEVIAARYLLFTRSICLGSMYLRPRAY